MSLAIEIDGVMSVLIAGTWHDVDNESFDMDSYEFVSDGVCVHGGGQGGLCATGFTFASNGATISGPLTAIQAVSTRKMSRGRRTRSTPR